MQVPSLPTKFTFRTGEEDAPETSDDVLAVNRAWVDRNYRRFAPASCDGPPVWASALMWGFGFNEAHRWIDVGCGPGCVSRVTGGSYTGADFCAEAVDRARDEHPGATFVVADATALPFPDRAFDRAISAGTIHMATAETRDEMIAELARLLEPGGLAFVMWPTYRETGWMRHPHADGPWWFTYHGLHDVREAAAARGFEAWDEGEDEWQSWLSLRRNG